MELLLPLKPDVSNSLGLALVISSSTPLLLLDERLVIQAASHSFCRDFSLDCSTIVGCTLFALGDGEWDIPQLRSLLEATASGSAAIDAYEIEFEHGVGPARRLVIAAHVLELDAGEIRLAVAVTDVTAVRQTRRDNAILVREHETMVQELNHRVANSLQIIASVLMQRVRSTRSEETRTHLRDAHHRVMSVATLQRQLAATAKGEVNLRLYFTDLCASIGASMIPDPAILRLTVDIDAEASTTGDRSVSMGLIVTELVINSLKHAYPGEAKGAIRIGYHADHRGWILSVADDGIGITDSRASGKPGLGTGIVNALAGQLSARVEISDAAPGCLVSIVHRRDE
jgi:two-component system, sensor histidine kinase PdtaS